MTEIEKCVQIDISLSQIKFTNVILLRKYGAIQFTAKMLRALNRFDSKVN